jgi:hypothetical protein
MEIFYLRSVNKINLKGGNQVAKELNVACIALPIINTLIVIAKGLQTSSEK